MFPNSSYPTRSKLLVEVAGRSAEAPITVAGDEVRLPNQGAFRSWTRGSRPHRASSFADEVIAMLEPLQRRDLWSKAASFSTFSPTEVGFQARVAEASSW